MPRYSLTKILLSIGLVGGLSILLAACGASTPTVSGAKGGPIGGAATAGPSAVASGAADSPEPDRHGAPELEGLLPASVSGIDLERLSLSGADFYAEGTDETRAQLDTMLRQLGKTVADLSVGDAGDPTGKAILEVGAFRVAGAAGDELLAGWVASHQAASPRTVTVSNVTIADRALTKIVDSAHPVGGVIYAYAKGDTLFLVSADDSAYVSDALRQLPKP